MPTRNEQSRAAAKAEYLALKQKDGKVNLRELAEQLGVAYSTIRKWKSVDQWDAEPPKRKPGAPFGNKNSAGHRNAAGSHEGAPPRNRNAQKDGAYSAVFLDTLTDDEQRIVKQTSLDSRKAWKQEMQILKIREYRILTAIARYESAAEEELYLTNATNIQGGKTGDMFYYNKDSAFVRILKLQEVLYKVQGRIAKIAESLQSQKENNRRFALEQERLQLLRMRTTGVVNTDLPPEAESLDIPSDVEVEDILFNKETSHD